MDWTNEPLNWTAGQIVSESDMDDHVTQCFYDLKLAQMLEAAAELTIATGVITVTRSHHDVDTEADAAADDLTTVSGGVEGDIIYLRAENAARVVTLKNGTGAGALYLGQDIALDSVTKYVALIHNGTGWSLYGYTDLTGNTLTQTLTNKTLTSPTINGTVGTTGLTMPAFTLGGIITGNTSYALNSLGRMGIGTDSSSVYYVNISETVTLTDNSTYVRLYGIGTFVKTSAAFTGQNIGSAQTISVGAANTQNWTAVIGGLIGYTSSTNIITGATGTVTLAVNYKANATIDAGTVTNRYGLWVTDATGAGAVTNQYGIYIDSMTKGGTLNYALYIAGGAVYLGTGDTLGTLNACVAKGTWTASGTWTIPAVTLGGTLTTGSNRSFNAGATSIIIDTTGAGEGLIISATLDGASGASLVLRTLSASPAVNDKLASIYFAGRDSVAGYTNYALIGGYITNVTDSTECGALWFQVAVNNTLTSFLKLDGSTGLATWAGCTHTGLVLTASSKLNPSSGVAGFSVVSTALTLGSLGSVLIPQSAADCTDALAGNIDGCIGIDSTEDGEQFWFRANGEWYYISKTGGLSMTKEERTDPTGHEFRVGDLVQLIVDKVNVDGSFHALPYYAGSRDNGKKN